MIIGIEVNPASREQKTGTEWYTVKLVEAMQRQLLKEGEQVLLYSRENLKWPFKRMWTQARLSWEMFRRPPDVLFVPAHAVPRVHPKKTVTTIHDIGFKRFPQLYEPKARRYLDATTKFAVKKCAKIITPSEFTKRELVELYHADPNKIIVTPLAPIQSSGETVSAPSHFFLTMSRIESKKNIATLVRAFEIFKERRGVGDPFELYLAGKPGFGYGAIKTLIDRSPVRASIKELGFVTDEQAHDLFARAYAYVYPSWYEGFGISAVDAMQSGAPIIASNIPALHEAAGDAALYFDPNSPQELARKMSELADNPTLREELHKKSLTQVEQFSWDKTAEQTWDVLRSML